MKHTGVIMGLVLVATLFTVGPALSQDDASPQGKVEHWTFSPKEGGNDFKDFIDILENVAGVSVVYDPNSPQVRGRKIQVKGKVTIPRNQVFSWVRSVLSFQRMILAPVGPREGNTWQICDINAPQVTNHPEWVPADELEEWADKDGAYIVTVLTLKHLDDTSRARNALAQLATRQVGRINDIPQTRSFVIGDFAPVVVAAWRMLTRMDEEAGKMTPEERKRLQQARSRTMKTPDPRSPIEKKIENYERLLSASHTSHAAQYFVGRILELKSELMQEKAKEATEEKTQKEE